MIYLFTGVPGAGKTLNAIKFALEGDQFKNRPTYAHRINELNVEGWEVIDQEQAKNWFELPEGSVIIIDECQDIWRPRKAGSPVPETVQRLEKHRHMGIDLILTCQYPRQIDIGVRRMVTSHTHLHRPMGGQRVSSFQWDKVQDNPDDYHERKKAVTSTVKLDKKIFDLYKSAEIHTVKRKIPPKLILLGILVLSLPVAVFFVVRVISSFGQPVVTEDTPQNIAPLVSGTPYQDYDLNLYLRDHTPLIENDPASAPIYQQVKKVKSFPRPQCLVYTRSNQKRCECYSQQATKLNVDRNTCLNYINNGYPFDYTRDESEAGRRTDEVSKTHERPEASADLRDSGARFTIVSQSSSPQYPSSANSYKGIRFVSD